MKSIFQKAVCKKEYHVVTETWSVSRWFNNRYYPEIFPFNGEPAIYIRNKFVEYMNILETDMFKDKFSRDDKVCIENEVYLIVDVIYGIDTYIYRLKEYELIDDEQSKEMAMAEYNKKVNEYKQEIKLEQDKRRKEEELLKNKMDLEDKLNKKWWKFWK